MVLIAVDHWLNLGSHNGSWYKVYCKTVEEARDIITSHMYWSICEGTEHGILSESENPMRDFNKPYTIADKE